MFIFDSINNNEFSITPVIDTSTFDTQMNDLTSSFNSNDYSLGLAASTDLASGINPYQGYNNQVVSGSNVDLTDITLDDVDDISTVKISKKQNEYEKILDFIENTKNPYIFKCNGKFVKIEFANSNLTVSECLILLVFNALDAKGQDKINNNVREDMNLLKQIGFEVTVIDLKEYFDKFDELNKICQNYNTFCVMGGNVFVLRQAMKYSGFDTFLKKISNNDNNLYIGYSAGSCVLSKRLDIFESVDEPIDFYNKGEIVYDGIGFINYTFIPHYKSNYHKAYLIDEIVDTCKKDNIEYKAFRDGEVIIENVN